jgi:ComF family protein
MVNIWSQIDHIAQGLPGLIYPACCALCGNSGACAQDICAGCRRALPWNRLACPRCALSLPGGCAQGTVCARCQQRPPPYDRAWSALCYLGVPRWLHRRFKFGSRLANSRLLGTLLADALEQAIEQGGITLPDRVVVMPLHPRRLVQRGFNQSLELIRPAVRRLELELDCRGLQRVKPTRPQSELPADRRRCNVHGAFACARDLSGLHVALFDDVITTGHTVAEAARVLRRAGAREISVWSLARTPELDQ